MNYIRSKKYNIYFTVLISIICFVVFRTSGVLDTAGMAAIILNWLPLLIGLSTIIMYLIANVTTTKYAWIITILGSLFNLALVARAIMAT